MRLDFIPPRLLLSAFTGALLLAAYLITVQGPPALALPGILLLAVIVLAAVSRAFVGIGAVATILATLTYVALVFLVTPFADLRFVAAVAAVVGYALAGFFAVLFTQSLGNLESDLDRADLLIEELTMRDPLTGTIKPQFARQLLAEEVARSRRYRHTFSVVMIGVSEQVPPPAEVDLDTVFTEVGRALVERLRSTDKVALLGNPSRFLILLVETPLEGAKIITERLVEETRIGTGVQFCAGIATFPDDAVDPDGLIREAESALQFASITNERVAYSELLRHG